MGEQLFYALTDGRGDWLGVLVFCAAARRWRARDRWIGWSEEQRRRRLPLVVNHCRCLLRPHKTFPNLGSRALRLTLDRLSADWQKRYGHPVVRVETCVDPEQFCGTVYTASGWQELGATDGFGRVRRDFYVQHHQPKRRFARELCRRARRSLAADQLKPTLAGVEARTRPRSPHRPAHLRSLVEHFKSLPDYRQRLGIYPLWSLVAIGLLAHWCGAPRGPKAWSLFAKGLSQVQRRARGIRRQADGYPAPGPTTFWRLLAHSDGDALEKVFLPAQAQIRGPAPPEELLVLDGKEPRHGGGHAVLTAVTVPSQHSLGSAIVDQKTNEIPVARARFKKLDLDGRKVSRDALHTQDQTARELVLEHGADYLFTAKDNQPTLRANIERLVPALPAGFSPSGRHPRRWRAGGSSTKASPKRASCVPARAAPRRWAFPAWNKSRSCAATGASTPRKRWPWSRSLPPEELNAAQWLQCNRAAWGIESGLPHRLDVAHRDDQCRVRLPQSMRVIGLFRRLSNSFFLHWRRRQKKPQHKTTPDFFGAMNAEHHRDALRCLQTRQPSFRSAS